MARHAILPRTAPFEEKERASLDAVLGAATPIQRAWLAGFLAGLDAAGGQPAAAAAPAAPPKAAEPLTILFASESGNSEKLASDVAKLARKNGFKPKIVDFFDLDVASLAGEKHVVAIAATWGEGEPPARAMRAYGELMGDGAPRLDGIDFAVLALGDTSYAEFCAIGKALDARFEALGAKRAYERADLDLDFDKPAAEWIKNTLKALAPAPSADNVVAVDFAARAAEDDEEAEPSREPRVVEVVDHVNLNSSRSDKETIHIALEFEDGAPAYEPGDSLEIYPENDPALVDEILTATGLSGDDALRRALLAERDITTLSATTVERFAKATGHAEAQKLIDSGEAKAWIEGRHLIDLIQSFPAKVTAEHLSTITRPLPPRAYSIASSRKEVGDEVHLVIAAVRYETHGRARSGVASTHVADRVKNGAKLRVKLKPNRHFRLPQDPATDIIMVGPGTGVAPFRAFVQERRAVEAPGRSWLFFGDRHFTHDFLYQLEWQDALEDGSLTQIDVAFSRDQPEKIYVQDRIDHHAKELVAWLDGGASFYVCGDANRMAKDVRSAVVRAYQQVKALTPADAEAAVAALERAHRYQQDVY
nr:flavodoxin domain-containing protein [Methylobacterium sp. OTU13CASTA1]